MYARAVVADKDRVQQTNKQTLQRDVHGTGKPCNGSWRCSINLSFVRIISRYNNNAIPLISPSQKSAVTNKHRRVTERLLLD
jgi:hypothetical protein